MGGGCGGFGRNRWVGYFRSFAEFLGKVWKEVSDGLLGLGVRESLVGWGYLG